MMPNGFELEQIEAEEISFMKIMNLFFHVIFIANRTFN